MTYKTFFGGSKLALRDVSLEIEEGEIFGILGPNAAGKTTLISILSTLLIPDRGKVKVLGMDAFREIKKVRERINISSGLNLPWSLSVYECLKFFSLAYGILEENRIENLIESFELSDFRDVEFEELSTGNKQKLSLAKTFVNDPDLVFLDEPTTGLDPEVARKVRKKIEDIHRERNITIVLTTHYMAEAEQLCDRIVFLNKGKIIAEGTQKELKKIIGAKDVISIEFSSKLDEKVLSKVREAKNIYAFDYRDNKLLLYVDDSEKRVKEVLGMLNPFWDKIKKISMEEATLEDVFLELAKRD
ncbi:ABC transporter ATP-binding protein [Archaeoglobales archaeon]|nr:MAG: ABC transporter ATP-binding protein [Archaeoglobales archaeon]